jgi:3-methyladenine DNA glycosylase AlkC
MMKAETSFSLKDQLFNKDKVTFLAAQFAGVYPSFKTEEFIETVIIKFPELELKQRIEHITACLTMYLPDDYLTALEIIIRTLPAELDPDNTDDDFGDFIIAPLSHYVALHGCSEQYLDRSLAALAELTKRFSAEDAIRYFINQYPLQTLNFLEQCATDSNYHVRRLASEGTRPKLPWSQKLIIDYEQPMRLLDLLYADHTRYVTRSVANHLNDISKIAPELVLNTLGRWHRDGQQESKEMGYITRHSLRTLVKKAHPGALHFLGYGNKPDISIHTFETITPTIKVGEDFVFKVEFQANKQQGMMIDYVMVIPVAKNRTTEKVFKLKQCHLASGQRLALTKKHPMRLMTTRRLYPGRHLVKLRINGITQAQLCFMLSV